MGRHRTPNPRSTEPTLPAGYRAYAIGDVHGCDELLGQLLGRIESDNAARGAAKTIVILLGDLIDRGPASRQVIERLRRYDPPGMKLAFLLGNHEEVLLRILRGEHELVANWLRFGGAACLTSYGVDPEMIAHQRPGEAAESIRAAIPGGHVAWLQSFVDTLRLGDYLFVHAGIRPGMALGEQSQGDLRWIRRAFLDDNSDHGFVVIHGHTIAEQIDARDNRIGLDTGAYYSGVLTAMGFEGRERWALQTPATERARNKRVGGWR